MIWEIAKDYLKEYYNNDIAEAIKQKDGMLWTDERIKGAFRRGNGTEADLKREIYWNRKNFLFVDLGDLGEDFELF